MIKRFKRYVLVYKYYTKYLYTFFLCGYKLFWLDFDSITVISENATRQLLIISCNFLLLIARFMYTVSTSVVANQSVTQYNCLRHFSWHKNSCRYGIHKHKPKTRCKQRLAVPKKIYMLEDIKTYKRKQKLCCNRKSDAKHNREVMLTKRYKFKKSTLQKPVTTVTPNKKEVLLA